MYVSNNEYRYISLLPIISNNAIHFGEAKLEKTIYFGEKYSSIGLTSSSWCSLGPHFPLGCKHPPSWKPALSPSWCSRLAVDASCLHLPK
jgi:hypothetical protein